MSDLNDTSDAGEIETPNELELLKERAKLLNLKFSPNIGLDALRTKVQKAMNGETEEAAGKTETSEASADTGTKTKAQIENELRAELRREQLKLVRCRITCLNPDKASLKGEILTVANRYIGNVKKFVPFGEATEDGYHLPYCLYTLLRDRKFLSLRSFTNRKTNQVEVEQKWVPEFAIEVLPQLTQEELAELAKVQMAKAGI